MTNKGSITSFYSNSLAIRGEIQRFESVHPSIYAIYDLLELIPDPLLAQQIREHVVCIEDSFVNSQEWTLSRSVPDLRLGLVGHLASGKSALVHRYLTGSYMQDESPEGGRFKKEVVVDGNSYLLLIRDEGGMPELQFTSWADGVILVFSLENEESFKAVFNYYSQMCHHRSLAQVPLILVGTQDAISETRPRVIDETRGRKLALELRRCPYYETCATYGLNVERVFQEACQRIVQQKQALLLPPSGPSNGTIKENETQVTPVGDFLAPSTPSSTPNTSRKNRRKSNLFQPLKRFNEDDRKLKNGEVGSGRVIPLRQGYLYKKSSKALNKEWKKKYVALTNTGMLTYHPSLHDYMEDVHGKEIPLVHTTVKIPGLRKPRSTTQDTEGGDVHLIPATNPTLVPPSLVKKRHRRIKSTSLKNSDLAEEQEGYEFIIVSLDNKQWQFEASSQEDRDAWVSAIEQQILSSLQGNESSKSITSSMAEISALRTPAGNQHCLDCDAPNPSWASLNLGGLMCIECSGIHRNLGSHISRVRSLDLDVWLPEHLSVMMAIGNAAANAIWEACIRTSSRAKPTPHSSREERERWIKAKYELKEFLRPLPSSTPHHQQMAEAISKGEVRMVYHILAHGRIDVNAPIATRPDGRTLLHLGAMSGNLAICQLLLWARGDPRSTDLNGQTPLSIARSAGHREVAQLFLNAESA